MPPEIWEKVKNHLYQAVRKVLAVASEIPQMTVLGIAGPGDALANPKKTFETFRRLQQEAPDIKLCLSTNGLALPEMVDEICQYNIDHVTITINTVDPAVGEKIYPWIFWDHRRVTGREAAEILHRRKMLGLERLTARGVLTKINSVLIPGINDEHLIEVNREVKKRDAFLHNIMPLISEPEHGTHFGLTGQRGPTAQELKAVQDACMGGANLMRHCRQCRADAVGLLAGTAATSSRSTASSRWRSSTTSASAAPTSSRWRPSARRHRCHRRRTGPAVASRACGAELSPDHCAEGARMKVTIRRTPAGQLSAYVPKNDLEEPIVAPERESLWGGTVTLANGWTLALPEMAEGTTLPITVEARRLSMD